MSTQKLFAPFIPQSDVILPTGIIQYDGVNSGPISQYTPGFTIANDVTQRPSLVRGWTIVGWTINARIGLFVGMAGRTSTKHWGKLGKLWGGIAITAGMKSQFVGAVLPTDLSTFTPIWDGAQDDIRQVPDFFSGVTDYSQYTQVSITYILNQPVEVGPGTQMQMAMVMTPSLIGIDTNGPAVFLVMGAANYGVLYDEHI